MNCYMVLFCLKIFFIRFKLMRSMDYTLNVGFSNMYIKGNDKTQ